MRPSLMLFRTRPRHLPTTALYCRGSAAAVFGLALLAQGCATSVRQTATGTVAAAATVTAPRTPEERLAILLNPAHPEWRKPAPAVSHLRFETTKGVFVLELVREMGPIGADRLYNMVRLGYYDDTRFHRVNARYIVQWGVHGNPAVNAAWKDQYMPDEPPNANNVRGSFAFAFKGRPNTRNMQIYINLGDNSRNNGEAFTMLGKVIEGMSVLDSLYSGYGENAGSGVRQERQGPLENGGNAFMDKEYPLLDKVLRATATVVR